MRSKPAVIIKVEGQTSVLNVETVIQPAASAPARPPMDRVSPATHQRPGAAATIYALIALGYTMVYGVLRFINFAHGDVFMLGAFIARTAWHALGEGSLRQLAILGRPLRSLSDRDDRCCGVLGMTIERLAYRPLRAAAAARPC